MARESYAKYLPPGDELGLWGIQVTSTGLAKIGPDEPYPPQQHPIDHLFTWSAGRVLNAYQLVYITAGKGIFQSAATGKAVEISAGTLFLLFPGVWHRYRPEHGFGWVETWIEASGPAIDRLIKSGAINPKRPLYHIGLNNSILEIFDRCHELVREQPRGFGPVVSTLFLQILALLDLGNVPRRDRAIDRAIEMAQSKMAESLNEVLVVEELAESMNVGYTHFRRAFKAATGVSPKQYHLELRLRKAMQLIGSTDISIQQISEMLGFDSPSYLSALIKSRTGSSPSAWRDKRLLDQQEP